MNDQERRAYVKARIDLCEELNEFLALNRGWLGYISWWKVNALLKKWIKENNQFL